MRIHTWIRGSVRSCVRIPPTNYFKCSLTNNCIRREILFPSSHFKCKFIVYLFAQVALRLNISNINVVNVRRELHSRVLQARNNKSYARKINKSTVKHCQFYRYCYVHIITFIKCSFIHPTFAARHIFLRDWSKDIVLHLVVNYGYAIFASVRLWKGAIQIVGRLLFLGFFHVSTNAHILLAATGNAAYHEELCVTRRQIRIPSDDSFRLFFFLFSLTFLVGNRNRSDID